MRKNRKREFKALQNRIERDLLKEFKKTVLGLLAEVQKNITLDQRVDLGFLRGSFYPYVASNFVNYEGTTEPVSRSAAMAMLSDLKLTDTSGVASILPYAIRLEIGWGSEAPDYSLTRAAETIKRRLERG